MKIFIEPVDVLRRHVAQPANVHVEVDQNLRAVADLVALNVKTSNQCVENIMLWVDKRKLL